MTEWEGVGLAERVRDGDGVCDAVWVRVCVGGLRDVEAEAEAVKVVGDALRLPDVEIEAVAVVLAVGDSDAGEGDRDGVWLREAVVLPAVADVSVADQLCDAEREPVEVAEVDCGAELVALAVAEHVGDSVRVEEGLSDEVAVQLREALPVRRQDPVTERDGDTTADSDGDGVPEGVGLCVRVWEGEGEGEADNDPEGLVLRVAVRDGLGDALQDAEEVVVAVVRVVDPELVVEGVGLWVEEGVGVRAHDAVGDRVALALTDTEERL